MRVYLEQETNDRRLLRVCERASIGPLLALLDSLSGPPQHVHCFVARALALAHMVRITPPPPPPPEWSDQLSERQISDSVPPPRPVKPKPSARPKASSSSTSSSASTTSTSSTLPRPTPKTAADYYVRSLPLLDQPSKLSLYAGHVPSTITSNPPQPFDSDAELYFVLARNRHIPKRERLLIW